MHLSQAKVKIVYAVKDESLTTIKLTRHGPQTKEKHCVKNLLQGEFAYFTVMTMKKESCISFLTIKYHYGKLLLVN